MHKKITSAIVLVVCTLASAPAFSMAYNVCKPTASHVTKMQQSFTYALTTLEVQVQSVNEDADLSRDTKKLLRMMYKYAWDRRGMDKYDFYGLAFSKCLDYDPQWDSY